MRDASSSEPAKQYLERPLIKVQDGRGILLNLCPKRLTLPTQTLVIATRSNERSCKMAAGKGKIENGSGTWLRNLKQHVERVSVSKFGENPKSF